MIRLLLWLANVQRRLLPLYFAAIGPVAAYAISGFVARRFLRLLPSIRRRIEENVRIALPRRIAPGKLRAFCERAFMHQVWNLTDLYLAERLLHRGTYERFDGRLPEPQRLQLLEAQSRRRPTILVTGYLGPFDLLPVFLGFNGIRAAVLYRPHGNPQFDAQRRRLRARSGCEMIAVADALRRLPAVLESGGTIGVLADHHDQRRGIAVTFLGLPTQMSKLVGLLAERYGAGVVVAGLRRRAAFRFEFLAIDVIRPSEWTGMSHDECVAFVTRRYAKALERLVLSDPAQYQWSRPLGAGQTS